MKEEIDRIFRLQNANCEKIRTSTASQRIAKLKKLLKTIFSEKKGIENALYQDLGRAIQETGITELIPVSGEIRFACKHLRQWMEPQRMNNPTLFFGSHGWIRHEAKGVCLILSPWNYPLQLAICPLVSAIAAGNCVILKPSEISVNTSRIIQKIIQETFPEEEVAVIQGDQTVATELLEKSFHHIFFTGSTSVGKVVMQAAAKNLASVTLELGGKSPVIIDEFYDLQDAVKKIAWGKFLNAGQTCVAPDYLLVPESRQKDFIALTRQMIRKMYGDPDQSPNYCKIVSMHHIHRLNRLVQDAIQQGARIETGGVSDDSRQYFAPTVLSDVAKHSEILNEEIFGPILPVIPYRNLDEAIDCINAKPRPLSMYIFSKNSAVVNTLLNRTNSGGVCINEVAVHFGNVELPFGGMNNSGIGSSHGYFGFRAFSHERAVLKQPKHGIMTFFYPPYTEKMKRLIDWTIRYL